MKKLICAVTVLAGSSAQAGVVLVTGSDGDTFHTLTPYATAVRDFLKGGAAADVLVLGGDPATTAYSTAVGGVGITTVSSLAGVDLSDFSALYLLSGSDSGVGCCEADVDLILGFEAAIQSFMASGGSFGIQTYTGDPGFDPLLGTVGGANGEVFGFMGGLGGPVAFDGQAVTPDGLLAGFTSYALPNWGHQGFRMNFFGDLGFVSLIDAPIYGPGVSGVMARGIAEGECFTSTSQEIVCHADGTTFTVNIEGLNACTGGTSMFTFTGSGGAAGEELCFTLLVDDGGFCCSTEICVTIPDCASVVQICDFEALSVGEVVTNQYPAATFSTTPGNVNIVLSGGGTNFICTAPIGQTQTCVEDTYVDFTNPVNSLSFQAIQLNSIEIVAAQVNVFINGSLDSTVDIIGTGDPFPIVDLTTFSNVTRIEIVNIIDDPDARNGIGWDNFQFNAVAALPCDLDGDGVVGMQDFLTLLGAWGQCSDCGTPQACPADFDGDCSVGIPDLLILLGNWTAV